MINVEWREFGTGHEAFIGPIRISVYKRGDYVADASWSGAPYVSRYHWQERRESEDEARAAAIETACGWVRKERASLAEVLESVGAPLV